ncbi:MAG: alpha/beta hydrolase [Hyphomonadaceae bacterium]
MDRSYVEAAGVRAHVKTWGRSDPQAPAALMIHGASCDLAMFEPTLAPLLSDRFRLAAYDRPGFGFTPQRPADAHTLGVQADVAAGVIDGLGLQRPLVIAHSYGTAVALRLAMDHPDKVSGLLLIAPIAYGWEGGVAWHYHWSSAPLVGPVFNRVVARPFVRKAAWAGLLNSFAPETPPEGYFEQTGVVRAVRPATLAANAADLVAIKRELIDQSVRYPSIGVRVGMLAGELDRVVSNRIHARALTRVLAESRLEVIKDAGHLPHVRNGDVLTDLAEWVLDRKA